MVELKALLLMAACVTAFCRPVWGFGIILLTTSTLFHLEQYLSVPLPVGYVEPTEALLATMLLALWLRHPKCPLLHARYRMPEIKQSSVIGRNVWPIMATYCVWQTVCVVLGLLASTDQEHFRFGVRFFLSGVWPWISLYVLARLSDEENSRIFTVAYWLMVATACCHILLQVTDYRPLMTPAYWYTPENATFDGSWFTKQVENLAFVRGLPQGLNLILFFTVMLLGRHVFARARTSYRDLLTIILFFGAMFIIASRSLMIVLAVGIIVASVLASLTFRVKVSSLVRITSILLLFVGAGLVYEMLRPGFFQLWSERIAMFASVDSKIFSQDNKARGLDNLAAMNVIKDHPLFGIGMGSIPREYALKDDDSADIHLMLQIGLVGGVPGMLMMIVMQVSFFARPLHQAFRSPAIAAAVVPYLAVLIMSTFALNMSGGGGTLIGPPIMFVTLFASQLWIRSEQVPVRHSAQSRRRRVEQYAAAIRSTAYLGRDTVIQPGKVS